MSRTDVAIAVTMMELCHQDACDTIALVTGDTDLLLPIRSIHKLFPNKQVWAVFPRKRFNEHLRLEADGTIKIKRDTYARHQSIKAIAVVLLNRWRRTGTRTIALLPVFRHAMDTLKTQRYPSTRSTARTMN